MNDRTPMRYDPVARYSVRMQDVEYRHDGRQGWLARLYQPDAPGPVPALLEVHGGAWNSNDRKQNEMINLAVAASGVLVAAVDFRLAPQDPYPASIADINYATRWLKLHARDFGGDATRLGAAGFSSGGHMVMLNAMRPRDARYASIRLPEAPNIDASLAYVIMGWPVIDPYSRYRFARETGRADAVASHDRYFGDEATQHEANPQMILERGECVEMPPALLMQGSADKSLTPGMAERFVSAYSKAGGVIELALFPGEPHGFMREETANSRRARALMMSFIARQLRSEDY